MANPSSNANEADFVEVRTGPESGRTGQDLVPRLSSSNDEVVPTAVDPPTNGDGEELVQQSTIHHPVSSAFKGKKKLKKKGFAGPTCAGAMSRSVNGPSDSGARPVGND